MENHLHWPSVVNTSLEINGKYPAAADFCYEIDYARIAWAYAPQLYDAVIEEVRMTKPDVACKTEFLVVIASVRRLEEIIGVCCNESAKALVDEKWYIRNSEACKAKRSMTKGWHTKLEVELF